MASGDAQAPPVVGGGAAASVPVVGPAAALPAHAGAVDAEGQRLRPLTVREVLSDCREHRNGRRDWTKVLADFGQLVPGEARRPRRRLVSRDLQRAMVAAAEQSAQSEVVNKDCFAAVVAGTAPSRMQELETAYATTCIDLLRRQLRVRRDKWRKAVERERREAARQARLEKLDASRRGVEGVAGDEVDAMQADADAWLPYLKDRAGFAAGERARARWRGHCWAARDGACRAAGNVAAAAVACTLVILGAVLLQRVDWTPVAGAAKSAWKLLLAALPAMLIFAVCLGVFGLLDVITHSGRQHAGFFVPSSRPPAPTTPLASPPSPPPRESSLSPPQTPSPSPPSPNPFELLGLIDAPPASLGDWLTREERIFFVLAAAGLRLDRRLFSIESHPARAGHPPGYGCSDHGCGNDHGCTHKADLEAARADEWLAGCVSPTNPRPRRRNQRIKPDFGRPAPRQPHRPRAPDPPLPRPEHNLDGPLPRLEDDDVFEIDIVPPSDERAPPLRLAVRPNDTLADVKVLIAHRWKARVSTLALFSEPRCHSELVDSASLEQHGITSGSVLHARRGPPPERGPASPRPYDVLVRTFPVTCTDGKYEVSKLVSVSVTADDHVADVKTKIAGRIGVSPGAFYMRIKGGRILADDLSLRGLLGRGAELDACARLLGGAPRKKQRVAPGDEANDDDAMPAAGPSGAPPVAPQPAPASPPASSGGRRTRARARVEEAEQQAAAAEARARPRNSSPRGEARVKLPELGTKGAEVARRGKADGRRSLGGLTEGEVSNIGGKGGAGKADTNATIRPTVVRFHSGASYRQQFEDALARRRVAYDRVDYYVDGPVVLYQIVGSDRPEAVRARQAMAPLLFGERRNMSLPADNAALARLVDDSLAALADEFVARVKDLLRPTPASVQRHGLNRDRLLIYLESNTSNLGGAGQPVAAPWEQAAPRADQITPITSNLAAPNFGGTARDAVYLLQKQRFEVDRRAKGAAKTTNQTLRDFIRFAGKVEPDGRRIAFGGTSNVLAEKKAGHVASTLRLTVGMLARLAELVRVRLQGHQDAVEVRLVLGEADGHIIADAAEDARQAQGNDTVVRVAVSSDRDLLYMSTEATGINGLLDLFDGPKRRKGRTIPPAKGLYWKPDVLKSLGVTAEQLKASVLISGSHNTTGSFIGAVKVRDLLKAGMPDRGAEDNYMIAAIKYLHARPAKEVSKRTREVLADGSAHRTELVRAYNETEGLDPAGQPLIRLRVPVGPFRPPPGTLFPKVNGQGVPLAEAFAGVGMTSKTMDRLRREIDKLDDKIEAGGATREMERLERERTELRGIIAEQRGRYGLWKKYSTLKDSLTAAVPAVPDSQPRPATAREAIKQRMHAGLQGVAKRCKAGFKIREEREEAAENHARSATKTFTDTTSGKIYLAGKAPIDVLVRGPAQPPAPAPPPPPAQDAPPTPVADVEMADEEAPIKKKPVSRKRKGKDLAFRTTAKDRSESEESEKDDEEATRGTTNKEPTPVGAAIVTVPGPLLANLGTDGWVEGMTHFRRLIRAGGEPSAAEVAQFMDGRLPDEAELLERGNLIGFLDTACTTTQRALMLCYATLRVVLDPYLAMGSNNRAAWFPQPGVDELPVFGKVGVIYRTLEAVALALRVPPDALAQTKDDAGVKIRHFLLGLDRQLKLLEAAHLDPPDIVSRLTAAAEKSTSNAQRTQLAGSLSTLSAAFHDLGTRLFPGPLPNPKAPEIKSWHLRSILLLAPFSSFVTPRTGNQEEDVTVADIRPPAPNPIGPPVPYDLTGVASLVDDDKMWYRTSLGSSAFAPSVLAVLGIVGGAAGLHGEDFVDSVEQGVRQHLAGIEPKVRGNPLDDKRHWLYGDLSTFDPDLPTTLILCNCPKVSVILGTRFHLENPTNRMLVASVNAVALDRLRVRLDEAESRRSRDGEDAGLQAEVAALKKAIEDIEAEMTILKEGNTVAPTGDARWDAAQRARKRVLGNIVFSDVQKLCPNIFRAKDPGASAGGGSNNGSDNGSDDTDDCCCDDCCRAFLPPADPSDAAENDRRRRIMDIHRLLQLELLRHDLRAFKPGTVIGLGRNLRRLLTAVGGNQQELRLHPLGFATGGVAQVRMRDSAGAVVDFEAIFAPHPVAGVKIPSHLVDSLTALALIPEPRPHAAAGHDATGAARPDLSSRIRSAASRAVDNVLVDACTTGLPMKADIVLAAGRRADVPEDLISLATRDSSAALFKDFAGDHFAAVSSLTLRNVKNGVKALAKAKASAALTGQATGAEPSGTNRAARALRSLTYRLAIVSNPRTAEAGEDESDDEGSDDEGDGEAAARDDRDTLSKIYCAPLELEPIQQDIAGLRALHADSDDALQLIAKFEAILISAEVDEPRLRTIDAIRATIGSTGSEFEPKDLEPLLLVRQAVADGSVRQRIIPRLHTGDRFVPVNSTIFSKVVAAYVGHVVETTKPAKQDQLALHDLLQRWDLHELAGAVDQRKTSIGYSYPVSETRILLRKLLHGIEELAKGRPRSDTQPAVSISTTPEPDRAPQGAGVGAGQAHAGPSADPPDPAATAPTTPRDRLLLRSANGFLSNGHATRITYHKQHRPYGFDRLGGVRTHAKETPKHWKWHSYCKNCETDGNDECDRAFPACSSCKDKGRSCVYSTASCEQCQKKNRVCDGVMPQCGFCERDGNNGCTWENVTSPAEFHDVTAGRFERELLKLAGSCKVEPGRPTPGAARTSKFARIVVTEGELCSKPGSAMAGQPGVQKADKGGKPSIYFFNHEHSEGAAKGAALRGIFVSMDPGTAGYTFTVTAFIESREQGGKLEQLTVHKKFAPLSTKEFGAQDESERSAEWWAAHERFSEGMKGVSRSPYPFDGQLAAATFLDNAGVLYSRSQSRSARMAKERLARAGQARKDSIVNWILASCDALWRRKTYIEAYNKAVDNAQVDWEGNAPSKERLSKIRDEAHARGNAAVAAIAEIPNPIVLCGAGQGSSSRMPYHGGIAQFLARHFLVVMLGEYTTSQICPTCLAELKPYPLESGDVEHKVCPNCRGHSDKGEILGKLVLNKNRSATLCLLRIFLHILSTGSRPAYRFTHPAALRNAG